MSDVVIRVENLSKRYRRGLPSGQDRLTEVATNLARALLSAPRRLWRRPPAGAVFSDATHGDEFWALKDMLFEVKRGEVVGIIGSNGAGKSTLLKILSRITEPTSGWFGLAGRVGALLEVGTGFHPELTGRENVYLNGSFLGMSRAEVRKKFDAIAAFAEIDEFLDTPVKRYSSGMQVRLGFAVVAHLEPDILIVDEVLAVGDDAFQRKCLDKVGEYIRAGGTVLLVTHSTQTVRRVCTRSIWVDAGVIRADGPSDEVIDLYAFGTTPTAELIRPTLVFPMDESLPIQFLRATTRPAPDVPEDVWVQFSYVVRRPSDQVLLCLEVTDEKGSRVFYANDAEWTCPEKRCLGVRRCAVRIPLSVLAPGRYEIRFGFWAIGRPPVHVPDQWLVVSRGPVRSILTEHGISWPSVLCVPPQWSDTCEFEGN